MNFIEKSLKYKQVTLSVLAIFFAVGVYSLLNMSRREDPKIVIPQGLVVAYYPGASSTQVEEQVTKKLEETLFSFEEVKKAKTTSVSEDGKVVITVELNNNVKNPDVFWSKLNQQLFIVKQKDLPEGVIGPIINSDFGDTEAIILGISGKDVPYNQLKHYAEQIESALSTVPAVSKIKKSGVLEEQIQVTTNSLKLAQYGLNLQDVMKVIQSQNNVYPTGNIDANSLQIPLYTKGFYTSQEDLANQIVGTSNTGSVVRLKDIAELKRTYADPSTKVRVGEDDALLISIQMLPGNNIVKFGEAIDQKLAEVSTQLPSSISITKIADQPTLVDSNINHFMKEFFLAIAAVVIVIILMLPFRIALVAATAIPMTVALTLGLMNVFGIELHQVSLSSLIVVLGLVVDDAIVVADNYVELLDKGENRWDAAWKSAYELIVPIFVATFTIIFAFMPMIILSGPVGEFIKALPLTVAISLSASFIVAMVFTPLLCYTFIKKGLHDHSTEQKVQKENLLDKMQNGYNKLLDWCVANPRKAVVFSIIPLIAAIALFKFGVPRKFFPAAERNQFVIELWMPTGTNLETTDIATKKLEALVKNDARVKNYTSFIGSSAPRFYYNFAPEFPTSNFSQIVINTIDIKSAEELYSELNQKVAAAVPEGRPKVRLMQQGKPLKAPIEVIVWGNDLHVLKSLANEVENIIRETPGNAHIQNDYKEDYYAMDIKLKPEAIRLGFTTEAIAKTVYASYTGAPITTLREGSNNVKVVFQQENKNPSLEIENLYVTSPVTKAKVPLSQIAEFVPVWKTGSVKHRNGLRAITVMSETVDGVYPSAFLEEFQPKIAALNLPVGYKIQYGGEDQNVKETFPEMIGALSIGLVLIFLIVLFQFRKISETLIIISTIPLSIFGAIFGLFVTGNNFGFTAFVGLISLSGVVVRNAIILIDHIHELVKHHGMSLREATIESGKRRLRPIFLTAMAAAIGVLPMIISGSPMWSPLASVIAFGVVWSMFVALLVVPAMYLLWIVPQDEKSKSVKH
ncbi:MAG TPA: efflux RND transporter permease subunit [Bacteroidia bacterium]